MKKGEVNNVLELAYQALVTEATDAMVAVFKSANVEVGEDFTNTIKGKIYDSLIMKVE